MTPPLRDLTEPLTAGSTVADPRVMALIHYALTHDVTVRAGFDEIIMHVPDEQRDAARRALVVLLERVGRYIRATEREAL